MVAGTLQIPFLMTILQEGAAQLLKVPYMCVCRPEV